MATIKSFTDLEQSKKLAEILPLESADMFYNEEPEDETYPKDIVDTEYPMVLREGHKHLLEKYGIPCWSLASLLSVLPYPTLYQQRDKTWGLDVWIEQVKPYSVKNTICEVDACYEMIIRLHEQKIL